MQALDPRQVHITDDFWAPRLKTNAQTALLHQWQQLERTGCIDNFRLVAGQVEGFRQGWFFADSDAYKWMDAACRATTHHDSQALRARIDAFATLLVAAQAPDGYLYTYNQLHFPDVRWTNLQIEHELYCHGHLIEAAIAHHEVTGERRMLHVAEKAADLLVRDFSGSGPEHTPGHQEVEIALIRLYETTGQEDYLDLAQQFVEQRGRIPRFATHLFHQNRSADRRTAHVQDAQARYLAEHPERAAGQPAGTDQPLKPPGIPARYLLSALSGQYAQQHRPVRRQKAPVGHAVRFAYLETAVAMLYRARGDETLLPALERAWAHMVARRMHVTGGLGSVPAIEGFGRDYELDPEAAYAETCAALGCMFWNWQMSLSTAQAQYADLFEWQLYNASAVGMGLDGKSYFYSNPLACRDGVNRQAWYEVPCCPSNLSRTWAHLGKYLYSHTRNALWVHQYVGSEATIELHTPVDLEVASALPWQGAVTLRLRPASPAAFTLYLRIPSWTGDYRLAVNGTEMQTASPSQAAVLPASGYAPQRATYLPVSRTWSPGDLVEIAFAMPLTVRRPHPSVSSLREKVALTRGPLVYCLESVDNPALDLFDTPLDTASLKPENRPELLGGVWVLRGQSMHGDPVTAIPYYAWANRGPSQMAVWVKESHGH